MPLHEKKTYWNYLNYIIMEVTMYASGEKKFEFKVYSIWPHSGRFQESFYEGEIPEDAYRALVKAVGMEKLPRPIECDTTLIEELDQLCTKK